MPPIGTISSIRQQAMTGRLPSSRSTQATALPFPEGNFPYRGGYCVSGLVGKCTEATVICAAQDLGYSLRNATTGLIFVARRAGT